jgi:autotransporter translocation and assembly factor TamB
MRILLRILSLFVEPLIFPLIFIAGTIYFLGETTAGLQTSIKIFNKFLTGELSVQHAQGKLFSEFTLNNISYHDTANTVNIQFLEFAWEPRQLLETKIYIKHLLVHDVAITSPAADSAAFDLKQLKFYLQYLRADQIRVNNLSYTENKNTPYKIISLQVQQNGSENFNFAAQLSNGDIQGTLTDNWNARWHFQVPDLATFIPDAKGLLTLSGTLTGPRLHPTVIANLNGEKLFLNDDTINQLSGKINLVLNTGQESSATLIASGIKVKNHALQKVAINISGKAEITLKNFATTLVIALNQKPYFNVVLSVPKTFNFNQYAQEPLYAKVNIDLINLQMLAPYIPAVKNLSGKIFGSLLLQGTLDQPHLNGDVTLSSGNVTLPKLGITLKNIAFHITGDESKRLDYTGNFQSGSGTAHLQGYTDFSQNTFPSTLTLQGKALQLVNLEEYKILASPDITITLADKVFTIKGKVLIPEAKIAPKNFNGVVTLPTDVVFVGQTKAATSSLMEYLPALQLNVTLGDKIYLHYQDIVATLKGNVIISKDAMSPATGVCELYATKGTYSAYKKILTIKQGRLVYTGNLITDPGLNIRAFREIKTVQTGAISDFSTSQAYTGIENLTVGVQVLGTLNKPVITLYSEPSLSQVDVLSYLILGIPSAQATGNNNQALLSAASALNLGGSSTSLHSITQNIQKTFGLSELNVESVQSFDQNTGGVVGKTSLVVGKQIAPNLYVNYSTSFSLLNPVSTFHLRYKLSKRFSIQSETSTIDTGADLLYSIERG